MTLRRLRRITRCFAVSLPVLVSMASLQAANTEIPLANQGFEQGLSEWRVPEGSQDGAKAVQEAASIGDMGLQIACAAGKALTVASPAFPVVPGESYSVSCWVGGSEADPGRVQLDMVFKDANGASLKPGMAKIRKWPSVTASGGKFFGSIVLAAAAPDGATHCQIVIRPTSATGAVCLDDFRVEHLGDATPVPRNPDGSAPIPAFDPERLAELKAEIAANPTRGRPPPKIVVKLDDLRPHNGTVHDRWKKVAEWAQERGIKISMGIIASGMAADCAAFADWVQGRHKEGNIEFWNHGWDHAEWKNAEGKTVREFWGSGYDHQKDHFSKTQAAAREKLGFAFASFGAPFNATDQDTLKVLAEDPDTKAWIYGERGSDSSKKVLERCYEVSIENPTFVANYAAFINGYAHNRGAEYFVLQGHPMSWGPDRWEQTNRIVDFLLAAKAEFVHPASLAP
jgi:peptidoglycan/xylan/chitin deacetylase (PgdA/CDA1 family)